MAPATQNHDSILLGGSAEIVVRGMSSGGGGSRARTHHHQGKIHATIPSGAMGPLRGLE
jgi:hypothetical protein